MSDVFFSYNSRDAGAVERIAERLREGGVSVVLDRWYLEPGDYWPAQLENLLNQCSSICIFQGPSGLGSWQQRERDFALDRQTKDPAFRVYPVILKGAEPALSFLNLFNWTDLREGDTPLERLMRRLLGEETAQEAPPVSTICPFQGLRAFREEDAAFFFGREKIVDDLVMATKAHPLVVVEGASGSGKSSVVRAGLLPRLRAQRPDTVWEAAIMIPQKNPFKSLAAVITPLLETGNTLSERQLLKESNELADDPEHHTHAAGRF